MSNIVKLQVPMDKDVRDALEKHAKDLGFDSAQAYIRVVAKAVADDREIDFGTNDVMISSMANARYKRLIAQHEADKKAGKVKSFDNPEEALAYLHSL